MTRRAIGLATLLLACLALVPAAAQAQYPYDWHAATPPSWFTESISSSCQIRESNGETTSVPPDQFWSLRWASPESNGLYCFKDLHYTGLDVHDMYCEGSVLHNRHGSTGDSYYEARWECNVGSGDTRDAICIRNSVYVEYPLGNPIESENSDSGGWIDPDTLEPYDCRPSESGDDDGAGSACDRAKKKVKKAKQKLQQADTAGEKAAARRKLKKAKEEKKEACG